MSNRDYTHTASPTRTSTSTKADTRGNKTSTETSSRNRTYNYYYGNKQMDDLESALSFEDNLVDILPTSQKSFEIGDDDLHEISEVDETGNLIDIQDVDDEELGRIKKTLKVKPLKKIPPKHKPKVVKSIKKVRAVKKMGPSPHVKKRHVVIVKRPSMVNEALFAGTNQKLSQIHALLDHNEIKKQATSEHKAILKKKKIQDDITSRLRRIESKLEKPKPKVRWLP